MATMAAAPGTVALVAMEKTEHNEPVGFILARRAADEAEILTLCTRPSARRRGVARQLLSALTARLCEEGARALFLEVDAGNDAALDLYRHLGFTAVGRRAGYYAADDNGGSDAVVMRRDLKSS